jgi:hypothetical protein
MDMRFSIWNIQSLYRASSLLTLSKKLSKYNSDLVGVNMVRLQDGATEAAGEYTIFYGKLNENTELGMDLFVHKRIISIKRVEFISDRMSYIALRGCWHHIIVLNLHAPVQDKSDDVKDSFFKELEHVFHKVP